MDEESVKAMLLGHKIKFTIPDYTDYLKLAIKVIDKILKVSEFDLDTSVG